jgi:hypothetical protein
MKRASRRRQERGLRRVRNLRFSGQAAGGSQRAKEAVLAGDWLWQQTSSLMPDSSLHCSASATLTTVGRRHRPHSSLHHGAHAKPPCPRLFILSMLISESIAATAVTSFRA